MFFCLFVSPSPSATWRVWTRFETMYLCITRYTRRAIHFFFPPEKPIPKKTYRCTSHKSKVTKTVLVDEMERERETFSAVTSVTHCLRGGTVGGRCRLVRWYARRCLSRWMKKKIKIREKKGLRAAFCLYDYIFMFFFWSSAIGFGRRRSACTTTTL